MRQRIHSGGRRELRRQADGQLRIEDRHLRHDRRMKDDLLLVGDRMRDDAGAAHFRTGASRRRHGDDGRNHTGVGSRPPVADILEIENRDCLPMHQRDHLGGIEPRAATECDDAIVLAGPEGLATLEHILLHRIGAHIREHRRLEAGLRQVRHDIGNHRRRGKALVGDEQRAGDAMGLAMVGKLPDTAIAELDGCGKVEVAIGNGHACSFSKPEFLDSLLDRS